MASSKAGSREAVQGLFTTFVYNAPLVEAKDPLNLELLAQAWQIRDFDEEGQAWSEKFYPGGYTSFGSMDKLHEFSSTFAELARRIDAHVARYARELDYDLGRGRLRMTDCWLNIMEFGTNHGSHIHPNSVISGTYYVQTPRGGSVLKFEDPRIARFMVAPPQKKPTKPALRRYVSFQPKAGEIILFESWLNHEVPTHLVKKERVGISFNYDLASRDAHSAISRKR